MSTIRALLSRLAGVFNQAAKDRELQEEIDSNLQLHIEDCLRSGMTPEEARRHALVKLGGLVSVRESCRDRRSIPWLESGIRDLRHSLRMLRRSPGFTLIALLLLALGIGANTAIFTLLDRLMLRPLPVKDPDQLVMIWTTGPHLGSNQGSRSSSYPMYQDFEEGAEAFSYVFCRHFTPLSVSWEGQAERVMGELVSGNYFSALGLGAAVGRVFSSEEDDRVYKGHPAVVLSHQYWVARFAADPAVVGKEILVNSYPMVVVGVSAAGFTGVDPARSPQIRVPIQMKPLMTPGSDNLGNRRNQWIQIFARLKPGFTRESALGSLEALLSQTLEREITEPALRDIPRSLRERFLARKVRMESAASGYSHLQGTSQRTMFATLMAMVGLVLLIACFNVASLLIARAAARQKEVAVRLAIGASRGQLTRQLLIESMVLSLTGAGLGLVLSAGLLWALLGFLPTNGMLLTVSPLPDWRIFAFTVGLALLTGLIFGLAPAWQSVRVDLSSALKSEGAITGGAGSARLRRGLVTAQVAFSFLLLAGAGLFVKTLRNLEQTDPGFHDIEHLVTFQIDPARNGYSKRRVKNFCSLLQDNIKSLPHVKSVGYAWIPVLTGREADWDMVIEGRARSERDDTQVWINCVSPDYWETMGLGLIDGRDFDRRDYGDHFRVAIVNRECARDFFGNRNPVGLHIGFDTDPGATPDIEIVGVVENALNEGPREGVRRQVFLPFSQSSFPYAASFYVRTSAPPGPMYSALRGKVRELDNALPVYEMKTLRSQLAETLGAERLTATLSTAFGGLATLIAAVGLYGVLALVITRRTREIGLRIALGARRTTILSMVLTDAFGMLGLGLGFGVPCAYLLTRYVSTLLFGVTPIDAWTAAIAAAILAAATILAGVLPARRAGAIDPMQALRHD